MKCHALPETSAPQLLVFNIAMQYSSSQWTYYENSRLQSEQPQGLPNLDSGSVTAGSFIPGITATLEKAFYGQGICL